MLKTAQNGLFAYRHLTMFIIPRTRFYINVKTWHKYRHYILYPNGLVDDSDCD